MLHLTAIFHLLVFGTQLCISKQAKFDTTHEALIPSVELQLRQYHAVAADAQILFHDADEQQFDSAYVPPSTYPSYAIRTKRTTSNRPFSFDEYMHTRSLSIRGEPYRQVEWGEDEVTAPDVGSRQTLLELAKMTNNAYLEPGEVGWYDLNGQWNVVCLFCRFLSLLKCNIRPSLILLAGSPIRTGLGDMSLPPRTIPPLFSLLRERRHRSSEEAVLRRRRIRSMITCSSVVAAQELTGHGRLCATATEAVGNATRIA